MRSHIRISVISLLLLVTLHVSGEEIPLYGGLSFRLLENLEVQKVSFTDNQYQIILQQKGLSSFAKEAFDYYVRVMIYITPNQSEEDSLLNLNGDQLPVLQNVIKEITVKSLEIGGTHDLTSFSPIQYKYYKGLKALNYSYQRKMKGKEEVIVKINVLNINKTEYRFEIAYRISEAQLWKSATDTVFNSFIESCSTNTEERYFDKNGSISYVIPESWKAVEYPGFVFQMLFGPTFNNFTSNINIIEQDYDGTLEEYERLNLLGLTASIKTIRIMNRSIFDGIVGRIIKIACESNENSVSLRQLFYIFEAKDSKYIVTASMHKTSNIKDDAIDTFVKTIRIEK